MASYHACAHILNKILLSELYGASTVQMFDFQQANVFIDQFCAL